jgi:hypothetical protein
VINLYNWDWTIDYVTQVNISSYRDGMLAEITGPRMPTGIAIPISDEDNDDVKIRDTFPNVTEIRRYNKDNE